MLAKKQVLNIFDTIDITGVAIVLFTAFYYQLFLHELPCALCVFQRIALCLMTFGLILNITYGNQTKHYFLVIMAALLNGAMAATQILMHIVPGTGSYGDAVFSIHMYTWNFIISILFITYSIFAGLASPNTPKTNPTKNISLICKMSIVLIITLTLANTISVFAECGPHMCASDPTSYWISGF